MADVSMTDTKAKRGLCPDLTRYLRPFHHPTASADMVHEST